MVRNTDSINKIIDYFKKLKVAKISEMFFRSYRCLPNCGGCCYKFSLDYFEGERLERLKKLYPMAYKRLEKRIIEHNGAEVVVYSDLQKDNPTKWCINLGRDGLCKIHKANPFSCQFELNKIWGTEKKAFIQKRLYGRGWNLERIDGGRGALCYMTEYNEEQNKEDLELMSELKTYSKLFNYNLPILDKLIKKIIKYYKTNRQMSIL